MSTILKNESSLFAFMNFLKEKQALDQLHFCLAVEEFNKKIMNPELGEDTMKSLHEDALSLYNLHFKSDAEHKVPVSDNLVQEIKEILDGQGAQDDSDTLNERLEEAERPTIDFSKE